MGETLSPRLAASPHFYRRVWPRSSPIDPARAETEGPYWRQEDEIHRLHVVPCAAAAEALRALLRRPASPLRVLDLSGVGLPTADLAVAVAEELRGSASVHLFAIGGAACGARGTTGLRSQSRLV